MILSFAWTTDALRSGKKTCTRRQWSEAKRVRRKPDRTAIAWLNAYQQGRLVHQAWTNASFVQGARKAADIRLTQSPYQERFGDMPESDLEAEGGLWETKEDFINLFGDPDLVVWVVRFEIFQWNNSCRDGLAQAAQFPSNESNSARTLTLGGSTGKISHANNLHGNPWTNYSAKARFRVQ